MINFDPLGGHERKWRSLPPTIAAALAVQFSSEFVKATVFVGIEANGNFVPAGTGFLVAIPCGKHHFSFVATADHVVKMVAGDNVWVRLNRNDGGCSTVKLAKNNGVFDYQNDIALLPAIIDVSIFDQKLIQLHRSDYEKGKKEIWDPDVGDEVATVGLYSTHHGQSKNLPVVRIGHIALMPGEEVYSHRGYVRAYLIEIKSIAGLSGSPVYVNIPPVKNENGNLMFNHSSTALPLGMLTGYHIVTSTEDQIAVPQHQGDPVGADERDSLDQRNTGFAVVVPWEQNSSDS